MNYMKEIDAWLIEELEKLFDSSIRDIHAAENAFKKAVKDKILESYRNGQRSKRSVRKPEASAKAQ